VPDAAGREKPEPVQTAGSDRGRDDTPRASSQPSPDQEKLPGIRHLVAVGSGKGGVGKSTVAVNLAVALHQAGNSVGLIDADGLGPSIPGMLGLPVGEPPEVAEDGRIIPPERHGLKAVSMGMLRGDDNPAILRGPMVGKYLHMFVAGVQWGQLDYLILDRPVAEEAVRNVLLGVMDPELGDNIVDLVTCTAHSSSKPPVSSTPCRGHRPMPGSPAHAGATGPRRLPRPDRLTTTRSPFP